jgi:hypothetical protein
MWYWKTGETEKERAKAKGVREVEGREGIERPTERKLVRREDAMERERVGRDRTGRVGLGRDG